MYLAEIVIVYEQLRAVGFEPVCAFTSRAPQCVSVSY